MNQKHSKETGGQKSMSSNTWIIICNSILHLPNLGPCVMMCIQYQVFMLSVRSIFEQYLPFPIVTCTTSLHYVRADELPEACSKDYDFRQYMLCTAICFLVAYTYLQACYTFVYMLLCSSPANAHQKGYQAKPCLEWLWGVALIRFFSHFFISLMILYRRMYVCGNFHNDYTIINS